MVRVWVRVWAVAAAAAVQEHRQLHRRCGWTNGQVDLGCTAWLSYHKRTWEVTGRERATA